MKRILLAALMVAAIILPSFAASPYYTTKEVWSPTVVCTTSTFSLADNVYLKDIKMINLSTGVVTFGVKAASAVVDYFPLGKDETYTLNVDEKWAAVTTYIDLTHVSSNTWTVTMSSVNLIGVIYRYR